MRKVIYTRPDGGISVVHPILNTIREVPGFTEADAEKRAWDRLPADAINPRFVSEADIPQDRTFRNGWKDTGTAVGHDMPKCRELQREKIRTARKPLLAALDADYLSALETGDAAKQAEVIAQKQALRNAPANPAIDLAQTPDELKAITLPK